MRPADEVAASGRDDVVAALLVEIDPQSLCPKQPAVIPEQFDAATDDVSVGAIIVALGERSAWCSWCRYMMRPVGLCPSGGGVQHHVVLEHDAKPTANGCDPVDG